MRPIDRTNARTFYEPATPTLHLSSTEPLGPRIAPPRGSVRGRFGARIRRTRVEPVPTVATAALDAAHMITATTFVATAAFCWMVLTAATTGPVAGLAAWGTTWSSRGFRGI